MNNKLRREKLLEMLPNNSVFILQSKIPFEDASRYDVDRNYLYLTGSHEYNDTLVLEKADFNKEILFIKDINLEQEKWTGKTLRIDEAKELTKISDVRYLSSFVEYLNSTLNKELEIFMIFSGKDEMLDCKKMTINSKEVYVKNASRILKALRTIKDESEIEMIIKANQITKKGIEAIMANLKPGLYEYQVESYFDQAIKYNGATGFSFPTIAASGINATCLHYSFNDSIINDGDLVLFDLGASLDTYCADISRTFPANGKFTERQRLIYEIVLNGQKLIERTAKPGYTTRELNEILIDYFFNELKKIGLVEKREDVRKYYFHGVSHHLGMDCHDYCLYEKLVPGCVISNEPGLYIPEWNIGVRIEDDILITENGTKNLSEGIIKEVTEIEEFMSRYHAK